MKALIRLIACAAICAAPPAFAEDDAPNWSIAIHGGAGTMSREAMTEVKRAEYEEFLQVISPWEREHLLLNV